MSSDTAQPGLRLPLAWPARPSSQTPLRAGRDGIVTALDRKTGQPLGKQPFRELLNIEWARAGRAGRDLRLLRISLKPGPRGGGDITPAVAARIFGGLTEALRDTDIIGWHREGRVVGAILIEGVNGHAVDPGPAILQRVRERLDSRLPPEVASRMQLRIVRVRPKD